MIIKFIWSPVLITALAVAGYIYGWPVEVMAPALFFILIIGSVSTAVCLRARRLERALFGLKERGEYFVRHFASDSPLSVFVIINSINSGNAAIREWVQACNAAQFIFNAWCDGFIARVRSDARADRVRVYLPTYLGELWSIVSHYHEFVEQFHEVASKSEIPSDVINHYHPKPFDGFP